jgi:cytochrome c oxidase cbb3-type subunit I/II
MPAYPHLLENELNNSSLESKIRALRQVGVPYPAGFESEAKSLLDQQAAGIANNLLTDSIRVSPNREVIALIAYMQRLGKDITQSSTAENR